MNLAMSKKPLESHGSDDDPSPTRGRRKVPYERRGVSVKIRKATMLLVDEEMKSQRPYPNLGIMIQELVEDGLRYRGYGSQMPWLHDEARDEGDEPDAG